MAAGAAFGWGWLWGRLQVGIAARLIIGFDAPRASPAPPAGDQARHGGYRSPSMTPRIAAITAASSSSGRSIVGTVREYNRPSGAGQRAAMMARLRLWAACIPDTRTVCPRASRDFCCGRSTTTDPGFRSTLAEIISTALSHAGRCDTRGRRQSGQVWPVPNAHRVRGGHEWTSGST